MDEITEGTRNEIIRHYGLYFLPPHDQQPISAIEQDLAANRGPVYNYLTTQGFHRHDEYITPLLPLGEAVGRQLLHKSLIESVAWGGYNDKKAGQAEKLTNDFFSLLTNPSTALYFAIRNYCLHDNFFESGLIAIDGEKVIYAWFEETD